MVQVHVYTDILPHQSLPASYIHTRWFNSVIERLVNAIKSLHWKTDYHLYLLKSCSLKAISY